MRTDHPVSSFTAPQTASLRDSGQVIDSGAVGIVVLTDPQGTLVGVLTDGDLRRALLGGAHLDDPALPHASLQPTTITAGTSRAHALDLMNALHIEQLPVVDAHRKVVGLHTLADVMGHRVLPNVGVVMAGGRGVRLGELTQSTPKPLVPIAGRPIIEWVLLNLVSGGIREFYISVNYLADQIIDRLGDGACIGARIHYIHEEASRPLGTAGSLSLLDSTSLPVDEPLVVTNADLMVQFDVAGLIAEHKYFGNTVTVATRRYEHQVPFGVVERAPDLGIASLVEKPVFDAEVNAGIYAVQPAALEFLPPGQPYTMPELVEACLQRQLKVGAWAMESDWIDVGTPRDLARARGEQ